MKHFDKLKIWADTFESKAGKLLALWGTVLGVLALFPTVGVVGTYAYNTASVLINSAQHVKDSIELNTYQNFMIMQLSSAIHEEMDTKIVYGIKLEESNNGDLWYWGEELVFGKKRPVIYSANLKHKSKRVYIQDMYGEHKWISNE